MKDRIYKIMTDHGMNQKEFAEATGIATATLSNIFNGRTSATLNHVRAIYEKFPELNFKWLVLGVGEMTEGKKDVPQTPFPSSLFDEGNVAQSSSANAAVPPQVGQGIAKADILETVKEVARQMEKPQRNVVEIRVFFDDDTYDVFTANRK